jgi:Transferrin receptor-like dimerisation domain/Peptidase family M28
VFHSCIFVVLSFDRVFGAADPNSGTASLLEVARGLGTLVKSGWQPRRSIYLLSWSGEEYGLLGSTGWAELNADSLLTQAVAYLNVDTVVSGDVLSAAATPSLATIWNAVLHDLESSPSHSATLFVNATRVDLLDCNTNWIMNQPSLQILGSGSDYTAFLDHLGIASIDFSFGKKAATYGQYHSIYDSFSWMEVHGGKDGQPGSAFELMAYGAKIWGLLALRLADAEVLPFDPMVQGEALGHYVDILRQNEQQTNSRKLDLALLDKAVTHFQKAAETVMSQCGESDLIEAPLSESSLVDEKHLQRQETIVACNRKLGMVERKFLSDPGLPNRKWFKHVLQAPGMYLGYAAEAFPGVQYAMEMGNFTLAQQQVEVAQERITAAALFLEYGDEDTAEIIA